MMRLSHDSERGQRTCIIAVPVLAVEGHCYFRIPFHSDLRAAFAIYLLLNLVMWRLILVVDQLHFLELRHGFI